MYDKKILIPAEISDMLLLIEWDKIFQTLRITIVDQAKNRCMYTIVKTARLKEIIDLVYEDQYGEVASNE